MQREIQVTADGSHTVLLTGKNISYHSHHGAINESEHVFINAGLVPLYKEGRREPLHILEVGFGTGLNTLLTIRETRRRALPVHYTAIEPHPLTTNVYEQLNHGAILQLQDVFTTIHQVAEEECITIDPDFSFIKICKPIRQIERLTPVDCIYFDAFSPTDQPEMWTTDIFSKLYGFLVPGGVLVTYSSKTTIRNNLKTAGFTVTKIPGPFGKREMVRAVKSINS